MMSAISRSISSLPVPGAEWVTMVTRSVGAHCADTVPAKASASAPAVIAAADVLAFMMVSSMRLLRRS